MRILQIIGSLDSTLGGPIIVAQTVRASLASRGHTVHLLTFEAPGQPPLDPSSHEIRLGPSFHPRFRFVPSLVRWLSAPENRYDAVIVHGIWMYSAIAARRALRPIGVPYFVFVHGSLDPWFRRAYPIKHLKKWIYWKLFEWRNLRDAQAVLFTCEDERALARNTFLPWRMREEVIEYGIDDPAAPAAPRIAAFHDAFPALRGRRLLLFLSRVHPKKGLDLLIDAFGEIAATQPDLQLVIAGPEADGWGATLRMQVDKAGLTDRVTWTGMLTGDVKWGAYLAAELFCLPSHGENFGVVVAESLAMGLPVLISDRVNIYREVRDADAGIIVTDDRDSTLRGLRTWLEASEERKVALRRQARACFESHFDIRRTSDSLLRLIEQSDGPSVSRRPMSPDEGADDDEVAGNQAR